MFVEQLNVRRRDTLLSDGEERAGRQTSTERLLTSLRFTLRKVQSFYLFKTLEMECSCRAGDNEEREDDIQLELQS